MRVRRGESLPRAKRVRSQRSGAERSGERARRGALTARVEVRAGHEHVARGKGRAVAARHAAVVQLLQAHDVGGSVGDVLRLLLQAQRARGRAEVRGEAADEG